MDTDAQKVDVVAGGALAALRRNYVVVGKAHIVGWKAWLAIGIITGIAFGIVLVANRSGETDMSRAAGAPTPRQLISGVFRGPGGLEEFIHPQAVPGDAETVLASIQTNPLQFLTEEQKLSLSLKMKRYAVIPKRPLSSVESLKLEKKIVAIGGSGVKKAKNLRGAISFQAKSGTDIAKLWMDPAVEEIIEDRLVFLRANAVADGANQAVAGPITGILESEASLPEESVSKKKVIIGIVDTGVDVKALPFSIAGAKNYSLGSEVTRYNTFFQAWRNKHTFPIQIPATGDWLNVTIYFPAVFGILPSPSDLDLTVRDESGAIVGSSATQGSVPQSERVEIKIPKKSRGKTWTAIITVKNGTPRLAYQYFDIAKASAPWPAFTPTVEAGRYPQRLDVVLDAGEVPAQPKGALPSYNGKWKKGSFTLLGKKYGLIMSDANPEAVCGKYVYDDKMGNKTVQKLKMFVGYDAVSIDTTGDGDYSDQVGATKCYDNGQGYQYPIAPSVFLGNTTYYLDGNYSSFYVTKGIFDGKEFNDRINYLSSLNASVASFSTWDTASDAYGPRDSTEDFLAHGTHVAGIAHSIAPNASIYSSKVFGSGFGFAYCASAIGENGSVLCAQGVGAYESSIIDGIDGAIQNGARVINLSLGGWYDPAENACDDFLLSRYVRDVMLQKNITVVVAAGNDGSWSPMGWPACVPEVIAVGAVGTSKPYAVTEYSSRGPTAEGVEKPDLVAVGGDDPMWEDADGDHIAMQFPGGVEGPESSRAWAYFGVTNQAGNSRIKLAGTSMAAPQVSGAAARLLQINPKLTPQQIKLILTSTATDLGVPKTEQGAGLLNLKKALKLAKTPPKPNAVPVITVISPNGGETWTKGQQVVMRWKTENIPSSSLLSLALRHTDKAGIDTDYALIETANDGSESISVPTNVPNDTYRLVVKTALGGAVVHDESDATFSIMENQMTLAASLGEKPAPHDVVIGTKREVFANVLLWANKEAPEEIRLISAQFNLETDVGRANPINCGLFDGPNALMTGPYEVNPTSDGSYIFTLETPVTVSNDGGIKTLSLMCDSSADALDGDTVEWRVSGKNEFQAVSARGGAKVEVVVKDSPDDQNKVTMRSADSKTAINVIADVSLRNAVPGTANQLLGGFTTHTTAEDVMVKGLTLRFGVTGIAGLSNLTSIEVRDMGGTVIAGPKDITEGSEFANLAFTDLVVFPKGTKSYQIYGNIGQGFSAGQQITTLTIPSTWTGVVGAVTGTTVVPEPAGAITLGTVSVGVPTLTVALDSASPSKRLALAGTIGVVFSGLRLHAAREAITLQQIALELKSESGEPKSSDVIKTTLWDGSVKVGEAVFSPGTTARVVLSAPVTIPDDGDKILTIRADLAKIGTGSPGRPGEHLAIDYDGEDELGTYGIGVQSGERINTSTVYDTVSAGVLVYRSVPTLQKLAMPSSTLVNSNALSLYRFSVTSSTMGPVGLAKFTFKVVPMGSVTASSFVVYGYHDSGFSTPAYGNDGRLNSVVARPDPSGFVDIFFDPNGRNGMPEAITVADGQTRYFELRSEIANAQTGDTLSVRLDGDAASGGVTTFKNADGAVDNDFIWSGYSTTTSSLSHVDWANGYLVPGLPAVAMSANFFTK